MDFVVLLERLLRLFETLAGDILYGLMTMWFVRYIQLETRTTVTPSSRRWNSGLIGMMRRKSVNRAVSVKP